MVLAGASRLQGVGLFPRNLFPGKEATKTRLRKKGDTRQNYSYMVLEVAV